MDSVVEPKDREVVVSEDMDFDDRTCRRSWRRRLMDWNGAVALSRSKLHRFDAQDTQAGAFRQHASELWSAPSHTARHRFMNLKKLCRRVNKIITPAEEVRNGWRQNLQSKNEMKSCWRVLRIVLGAEREERVAADK